jgi:pimeloyl-ACP methyl ester carboxylesterase
MKVVLVHGMFCSSNCWHVLEGLLLAKGIEVVKVSLHPGGEATPGRSFSDVTASVHEQIAEFVDQRSVLVGHSLGALVVQQLLPRCPLASAVLVNPSPEWGTFGPLWPLWMVGRRGRFWRGAVHLSRDESRALLFQGLSDPAFEAAQAHVRSESGELVRQAFWFFDLFAATTRFPREANRDIAVVTGALDPLATPAVCARLVTRYGPGSRLDVVPDAGHMLMLQTSGARLLCDRIAAVLDTFENDPAPGRPRPDQALGGNDPAAAECGGPVSSVP